MEGSKCSQCCALNLLLLFSSLPKVYNSLHNCRGLTRSYITRKRASTLLLPAWHTCPVWQDVTELLRSPYIIFAMTPNERKVAETGICQLRLMQGIRICAYFLCVHNAVLSECNGDEFVMHIFVCVVGDQFKGSERYNHTLTQHAHTSSHLWTVQHWMQVNMSLEEEEDDPRIYSSAHWRASRQTPLTLEAASTGERVASSYSS